MSAAIEPGSVEGFILVGGMSQRMGSNKAELIVHGKGMVGRAKNALSQICDNKIRLAGRTTQENISGDVVDDRLYFDAPPESRAALIGLHTALAAATSEWIAVLACDLPLVTGEMFQELLTKAEEAKSRGGSLIAAVPLDDDEKAQPLAAVYHISCLQAVKAALKTHDWSVRSCLLRISVVPVPAAERWPGTLFNMNTPDDYRKLEDRPAS